MFIQGRRHLGILRRAKPLPAMPRCHRWQRGRETSCSCLVSVQERRVHVQLSGSYLRGSSFGHGNSVHNERYTRTPRTCPLRARQRGMRRPRSLQMPTPQNLAVQQHRPQRQGPYQTATTCISAKAVTSSTVLWCGGCIASDSTASLSGVSFSISTPCSLTRVLFPHRKT